MIKYSKCESGCTMGEETEYVVCARCHKATKTEVESVKEQRERIRKEEEEFIKMAEGGREKIKARFDSLSAHDQLMVNMYVGGEWTERKYPSPLTPLGRALGIILLAEAMMVMVPEESKPWIKDGVYLDMEEVNNNE